MCAPTQWSAVRQVRVPSRNDRESPGWAVQVEPFHRAQLPGSTTAMHMVGEPQDTRTPSAGKPEGIGLIVVSAVPAYCRYLPSNDTSMQGPPRAQETLGPRPQESVSVATGAHQPTPL